MAAKNAFSVTATKIMDGIKKAYTYNGSGLTMTLQRENVKHSVASGSEDTLITLMDGTQITCQEELADFNTDVSATDITGS